MGWSTALISLLLIGLTSTQDLAYNINQTNSQYNPYNPYTQNPNQYNPNQFNPNQFNPNPNNPNQFNPYRYDDNNLDNDASRGGLPPISRTGGLPQQPDRPSWRQSSFDYNRDRTGGLDSTNVMITEATYFIVASRMVRPGQLYRVAVTLLKEEHPLIVR